MKPLRRVGRRFPTSPARLLEWPAKIVLALSGFCVVSRLLADAVYFFLSWNLLFSQTLWFLSAATTVMVAALLAGLILEGLPSWGLAVLGVLCPWACFGGFLLQGGILAAGVVIVSCFLGLSLGRWFGRAGSPGRGLSSFGSLALFVAFALSSFGLCLAAVGFLERLLGPGSFTPRPVFAWDLARLLVGLPTLGPGIGRQEVLIAVLAFPLAAVVAYTAASSSAAVERSVAGWAWGISLAVLCFGARWWRLREIAFRNPLASGLRWLFPAWAVLVAALALVAWLKPWRRK